MEPLDVVRWLVITQSLLLVGLLVARALPADPREAVRYGRVLLVVAFVAPILVQFAPMEAPVRPAVQLWAGGGSYSAPPTLSVALGSEPRAPMAVDDAGPWLLAGTLLFALVVVVGLIPLATAAWSLRTLLLDAIPVRRIGRVHVVVSASATSPFAARLPGSAWIVLDADTFARPDRRRIAVQHELQHHRHGDTIWAWLVLVLGIFGASTPIVSAWRRWLVDQEELAVDAALVRHGRVTPRAYAEVLRDAAVRALAPPVACPGLTVAGSSSLLTKRVTMLLVPVPSKSSRFAVVALVLGLGLVVGTAWAADGAVADHRVGAAKARSIARNAQTEVPLVVNDQVVVELNRMIGRPAGRQFVAGALERQKGDIGKLIDDALAEAGLPAELAAVALVESGFTNLGAPSVKGGSYAPGIPGAGVWMFIPATARAYGLTVTEALDERLDPVLETSAAIALLSDNHDAYGDWWLAFAAYNQGNKVVDKAIAEGGTRDVFALQQKGLLNEYAATVAAAMLILEEPTLVR